MRSHGFIFHDKKGGRWGRFKFLLILLALILILGSAVFLDALFKTPRIDSPSSLDDLKKRFGAFNRLQLHQDTGESRKVLTRFLANRESSTRHPGGLIADAGVRAAFFSGWDDAAFRSLEKNAAKITHLCPEWLSFVDMDKGITELDESGIDRVRSIGNFKLMPVLDNLDGSRRVSEGVEYLMQAGKERQQQFTKQLAEILKTAGASGVVIDWAEVDEGDDDALSGMIADIATQLKAEGLETWLCINPDASYGTWDFKRLQPVIAKFIILLHDEHGELDEAGPIASQDWFEGWLDVISSSDIKPDQWIISIGCQGLDWTEGTPLAESITFADAMSRAGNAGCINAKNEAPALNGTFSYHHDGQSHEVWFLDAVSFANQQKAALAYGFNGFAINRIGTEDPGIWSFFNFSQPDKINQLESQLPGGDAITSVGNGEVVTYDPSSGSGHRTYSTSENGKLSCVYDVFPGFPTLFRMGATDQKKIALTFDDGPDPDWTPDVLDILKARGVKATFFVIGKSVERYPWLAKRIIDEGHEIGNHSFTHPNLAEIPTSLIRLELNATQRLIESVTGLSTTLFRPPYNADSKPSKLEELVPIKVAQSLGYMTILENIDPKDWQTENSQQIIDRIKDTRTLGNIVLLHDGGGDRSGTVEALPKLLDYFTERGDQLVTIGELLGMDSQKILPPVTSDKKSFEFMASGIGFYILRIFLRFVEIFLVVGTVLVVMRTVLVLFLATRHRPPGSPQTPLRKISVLVPAYNEEKVIEKTVNSLLASDYLGPFEVVVIDDGSTDHTIDVVEAIQDSRVRLLKQANAGKAHALQRGVDHTDGDILVFVDADTQFQKDALTQLANSFYDDKTGAVSGHARVGNTRSFLARCQDLEYISGFNLDRRAYAYWNCITVVPGAISAVRREAIMAAGGFSFETLAEDTDLTLAIHKAGYRIDYQPEAIAFTEAPETFKALASQRFRWAFGTLQCVFKHSDMLFNPKFKALGFFSLPGILFFQILLVAFAPFIDILLIQSLFLGHGDDVLPYFAAFILCDLILAAVACQMEGIPLRTALRIIPQRFVYRPLLSYVVWKSILHAMRGAWVGWGKLQRTASVSVP